MVNFLNSMRRTLALWAFVGLFVLPWSAQAQQWVATAYLKDPSQRLTIEEVAQRSANFTPAPNGFAAGYTHHVHWLRFELRPLFADPSPTVLEIRPPFLDDVRLFIPREGGGFDEKVAGDRLPFSSREIPHYGLAFSIPPLPPEGRSFYIRLQTSSSSVMALRHWTQEGYGNVKTQESAALGLYYGILLSLLTLLAWQGHWRSSGLHRSFLVFTAAITLSLLGMNGLVAPFLGRDTPAITDHWTSISTLLLYASFGPLFQHLFETKVGSARHRFFQMVGWAPLLGLLAIPLGWYTDVIAVLSILVVSAALLAVYLSLQPQQLRTVGGSLIAAAMLFAAYSGTNVLLSVMGILPSQFWFVYGFQIGMLVTLVLLMLMLVARSRVGAQQALEDRERAVAAEAQAQAERQSRQELSRFVAIFSHEIKTPLAVIKSSAESLQMVLPTTDSTTHQRLARIVSGTKRINLLAEQFLRKDEIDEDGFEPERKPLDLARCLSDAVDEVDHEQRVRWLRPLVTSPWRGDPLLISILVSNLVGNALKYSPSDQSVTIDFNHEAEQYVLRVQDHGPGIESAQLPHIFNSYYRGQPDGAISGSGLGLHLVKRIAELHGARVQVQSQVGHGSTFSVYFPKTPT
jgi:signal transduction histidine kinase